MTIAPPVVNGAPSAVKGWGFVGAPTIHHGFACGSRYPSLVFAIGGPALPIAARRRVGDAIAAVVAGLSPVDPELQEALDGDEATRDWDQTLAWLLRLIDGLQEASDLPVCEPARRLSNTQYAGPGAAQCQVATCSRSLTPLAALITLLLELLEPLARGAAAPGGLERLASLAKGLKASGFKGANVPRFVGAAHAMGLPFRELPGQFFRYGEGHRGRWLDSSYTQETPHISAQLVRDKAICSAIMRMAGLPVPHHQLATSAADAVRIAQGIGFPVVVKPADKDGGSGVYAGLRNASEVDKAYRDAASVSKRILVEKHLEGRDYRLTVYRDELIWAVERVPASVVGNGTDTVEDLVAQVNSNPARGTSPHSPLKPIVLDDEALVLLASQGLSPQAVAGAGVFVRLKQAANVNSGGMPVAIFDKVHPDNAKLAIAATRAVRLDLAGIDLLVPDIARSWRETGGGICEINGQPQIGGTTSAHIYPLILGREIQGTGRVPTVLLLGKPSDSAVPEAVEKALEAQGLCVGWHDARGVRLGGEVVASGHVPLFEAGEMLAGNADTQVMVLTLDHPRALATGLPSSRVDMILDCGGSIMASGASSDTGPDAGPDIGGQHGEQELFSRIARIVAPACDGTIVAREALGEVLAAAGSEVEAKVQTFGAATQFSAGWLVEEITQLLKVHSTGREL